MKLHKLSDSLDRGQQRINPRIIEVKTNKLIRIREVITNKLIRIREVKTNKLIGIREVKTNKLIGIFLCKFMDLINCSSDYQYIEIIFQRSDLMNTLLN